MKRINSICSFMIALLTIGCGSSTVDNIVSIHSAGKVNFDILLPEDPTASQEFSADELAEYLKEITGSTFAIKTAPDGLPAIKLEVEESESRDDYSIEVVKNNIILRGNSDRALLYAVYDFLGRLGCQWLAPNFEHYKGQAEIIPHTPELNFIYHKKIREHPVLAYRKLDVAGARASTVENLRQLIEWMPKVRYNTLRFAMGRPGHNKPKWDEWRKALTPELQKRNLTIEVGGHGYQNFLNENMLNGTLFKQHPDWFGKDSLCQYSPSNRLVFNTENTSAVNFFIKNVIEYLKSRPEIGIFDLWPPDVGRWSDCAEWKKYGSPQDRQAHLTNLVNAAIKKAGLEVKTEMIAYSFALQPPESEFPDNDILLEICPINQSFEYQINDPASLNNREYVNAIKAWRKKFNGSITYYSYYRKQAWRSLANIIPHYLQKDLQWIASVPLNGISCYAEQGDWFSYELNHYTLACLAWDPELNLDSLMNTWFKSRYADGWQTIKNTYAAIEDIVPIYGSIPFSNLKSTDDIGRAQKRIDKEIKNVAGMSEQSAMAVRQNLSRLLLVLRYIERDLKIQKALASGSDRDKIYNQIRQLVTFLENNSGKGVFILTGNNDFARFTKKYGLTHQSLLD